MKNKLLLIFLCLIILLAACQPTEPNSPSVENQPTYTPTTIVESPTNIPTVLPEIDSYILDEFPEEQLTIGDPYTPELGNLGYDVQDYQLEIKVDPTYPDQFENQVVISAVSDFPSLEYVSFDFAGFDINDVEVNDEDVDYFRTQYKLLIKLNEPVEEGEEFQVYVNYSGKPDEIPNAFSFSSFVQGAVFPTNDTMAVISEPDGSRRVFPCNDHLLDEAYFSVDIITPPGLMGISNGTLYDTQELDSGETLYRWQSDEVMAPYLLTIAIGNYEVIEYTFDNGLIARNYVLPGTGDSLDSLMGIINEAMTYFEDIFGPYPFDTFGYVINLIEGVSFEAQATIVLAEGMVNEMVAIHEMIHMWLGNWVGLESLQEIWRNEGTTHYFTFLWLYRNDPESLITYFDGIYEDAISRDDLDPLGDLPENNMFGYETYIVGSMMIYKLREEMGDDALLVGFKEYISIYGGGSASDAEFQVVMEDACQCSLDEFFEFWLGP